MRTPLAIGVMAYAFFVPLGSHGNLVPPGASPAGIYTGARQADAASAPRDGYLTVNKIRIHYREWGRRGPALVLLHGLYDDARIWKSLAPLLMSDYHVVAPDRRGAGDSDTPAFGYDQATLVSDAVAVIQQKKLVPVNLIGHSAGAEVALQVAAKVPEMVRALILIDGGFHPKHDAPPAAPSPPCTSGPRACALLALENSSRRYDPELLYPRISCPTLLILARPKAPAAAILEEYTKRGMNFFDQIRKSEEHAKEVADKRLPHGKLAVIENTGHWIQTDRPLALKQSILAFLSGIR